MYKIQSALLTGAFAISSIFAAQAQTSANDDKLLVMNTIEASVPDKIVGEKKDAGPIFREGSGADARELSRDHSVLTIAISGGELNEKYTAEQYAKMLEVMFKDIEHVDMPTQVYFFIEESGDNRSTAAQVHINGMGQDMDGGDETL